MTNKNIFLTIGAIIIILVIGALLLSPQTPNGSQNATSTNGTSYNAQGKIIFGVTDAATDMGAVSSIVVTVNKAELHSATDGWVTVSSATKQYDLLALKQSSAVSLLADANLSAGVYDQARLMISNVTVVRNGISQSAKLPSGELKMVGNFAVGANATSSVVFDFMADKSLHMTGNGKLIFAPVIRIEKVNNVYVLFKSNNEIGLSGGSRENDENVGMDEKGEVKADFELKGNLNVDANGDINVQL